MNPVVFGDPLTFPCSTTKSVRLHLNEMNQQPEKIEYYSGPAFMILCGCCYHFTSAADKVTTV